MDTEYVPFLLVTANVGSVFEDVSALHFALICRACCHSKLFIRFICLFMTMIVISF